MSLSAGALPFKEPHTSIKYIKGGYYKYEVSYHYDPARKRAIPKGTARPGTLSGCTASER
jgi:hypothetical protein